MLVSPILSKATEVIDFDSLARAYSPPFSGRGAGNRIAEYVVGSRALSVLSKGGESAGAGTPYPTTGSH
jgi:hypothetical protein